MAGEVETNFAENIPSGNRRKWPCRSPLDLTPTNSAKAKNTNGIVGWREADTETEEEVEQEEEEGEISIPTRFRRSGKKRKRSVFFRGRGNEEHCQHAGLFDKACAVLGTFVFKHHTSRK